MSHTSRWLRGLAAAVLLLGGQGCELQALPVPVPADAGDSGDAGSDAGDEVDAGDAGDGGSAVRQLVTRRVFGAMPLHNRVQDPGFALLDGTGWGTAIWDGATITARVTRTFLPRTPLDQPALRIERSPGDDYCQVRGLAKGAAGPLEVSVWVGREGGESPTDGVQATLLGLFLGDATSAVDLSPDTSTAPMSLGGIHWQRLSAAVTDGPVGLAYLVVELQSSAAFISSPILIAPDPSTATGSKRPAYHRPLSHRERLALRAAAEDRRRRWDEPHPLPPPSKRWGIRRR